MTRRLTVRDVREVAFGTVGRLRRGYDRAQVDAFLARVAAELDRPGSDLTAADVREAAFAPSPRGDGYRDEEVDAFLDLVERQLAGDGR